MKHDWEQEHKEQFLWCLDAASEDVPDGFVVVGLVVAECDSAEACLVIDGDPQGVWWADVLKDMMGDAMATYNKCLEKVFK